MRPPRLPELRRLLAPLGARREAGGAPVEPPDEQQLQEELARRRAQAKAARERRLRKLMAPPDPEPPERTLTRQAMEQIRYLRRTSAAEWPLARLAQGFQVPPDVIRRVLKSRFCPSPERSGRQDARASSSQGPRTGRGEREGRGADPLPAFPAASPSPSPSPSPLPIGPGERRRSGSGSGGL